jgi:hypothetical protein
MTPLSRAIVTLLKYAAWTALSAGLVYVTNHLADLKLPDVYIPIIAAVLKSIATYVATQAQETK